MFNLRQFTLRAFTGFAVALTAVGCASDRPSSVPSAAIMKASGDRRVVYTADDTGTLYVSDQGRNGVVYSGPIMRGDRIVVDPKQDQLTINDRVVSSKDISSNTHKIFLLPGIVSPPPMHPNEALGDVSRPDAVPTTATLKGEGKDRLAYTAEQDGNIWVTDADRKELVTTAAVLRGDQVIIDPKDNRVMVNGRTIYDHNLPNNDHRIFFQPGAVAVVVPGRTVERTTTIVTPAAGRVSGDVTVVPPVRSTVVPPAGVPATASMRSDSAGRASLSADRDGTVWVVDAAGNRVIYTGRLLSGDTLTVDPDAGRLTLNGKPAIENSTLPAGRYYIYFQ